MALVHMLDWASETIEDNLTDKRSQTIVPIISQPSSTLEMLTVNMFSIFFLFLFRKSVHFMKVKNIINIIRDKDFLAYRIKIYLILLEIRIFLLTG